jgi:hypothetical protein
MISDPHMQALADLLVGIAARELAEEMETPNKEPQAVVLEFIKRK